MGAHSPSARESHHRGWHKPAYYRHRDAHCDRNLYRLQGGSGATAGKWFATHKVTAYCFAAVILAFVASLAYVLSLSGPSSPDQAAVDIELQRDTDGLVTVGEGRGLLPAPASSAGAQLGVDRPI